VVFEDLYWFDNDVYTVVIINGLQHLMNLSCNSMVLLFTDAVYTPTAV